MTAPEEIVNSADRYTHARGVVFSELSDGRGVLLSVEGGLYFTLNHTAREVWEALAIPADVASLTHRLAASYELDPAQLARDVRKLLGELRSHGLVRVVEAK